MSKLTDAQVEFFRRNGFIKLPTRLSSEKIAAIKKAIQHDIDNGIEPVRRSGDRITRLSNLYQRGGVFAETFAGDEVLDPLESLLGPHIELILNRHNHATLRTREDTSDYMHRDVMHWSRTICTVVFYLEDTNLDNGCTRVVPGTHLLPERFDKDLSIEEDEKIRASGLMDQALAAPMPAGGMLAIDSMVFHGAGTNTTPGTRMSLTAGYHSVDEISGREDPMRVVVRGERIYSGNY